MYFLQTIVTQLVNETQKRLPPPRQPATQVTVFGHKFKLVLAISY